MKFNLKNRPQPIKSGDAYDYDEKCDCNQCTIIRENEKWFEGFEQELREVPTVLTKKYYGKFIYAHGELYVKVKEVLGE